MNISLTPELEKLVQDKVNSGLYTSASEVIRESLRLLNQYDNIQQRRLVQLQQEIEIGLKQLDQSQNVDADIVYQRLKKQLGAKS